ncbi:CoA transferase [Falsiroseomonas selenitidurans]|nr:CoA transferase [Falsiroseomonas selenitidurans]
MQALTDLWTRLDLPPEALAQVALSGAEPALPSSFAIGTAAQASIAAVALAAAEFHRLRGGPAQSVRVAMRDAAIEFRSERYLRLGEGPLPDLWDPIAGLYRCAGGWLRVHTNFRHHRDGLVRLLGTADTREAVAAELARRDALAVEREAAEAGLVVAALRDLAEWDASAPGQAVAAEPLVAVERIGDAPPRLPGLGARPLSGIRVLELTRIIAGPVAGRLLAAHGAAVLHITAPHLPQVEPLVMDTGRGKRSAFLDLRRPGEARRFRDLATQADVVLQSYRPGGLDDLGLGAAALARLRPGLIHASLSAYGFTGPWAGRRGFDSLVQAASGLNRAEAAAARSTEPKALPAQALDHAGGTLLALGILVALLRRARQGGTWQVRVSLARTALWLRSLPRLPQGFAAPDPRFEEVADRIETVESRFGRLALVRHAARLSATPAAWATPPMPLGSDAPVWWG